MMSDKFIKYGPGCDIDPTGMEEHITYKEDVLSPDRELLRILWNALQQREERIQRAKEWAVMCSDNEPSMEHLIQILEGTDGE